MQINQQQIEFTVQIIFIIGALYKFIKIESNIEASIARIEAYLKIHKKEHDLLEYKMNEYRMMIEDQHRILKSNNLLNRSSD